MKVEDQKALAKYIIETLKIVGLFREVNTKTLRDRIVANVSKSDLENAVYNAIASWNAEEIEKAMAECRRDCSRCGRGK